MTFHDPRFLWLLLVLPLAALWRARRGRRAAVAYPSVEVARETARRTKSRIGGLLVLLRHVGAAALVVALARPQLASAHESVKASGIDLVLAVDVSTSMEALDMEHAGQATSRLEAVKEVVRQFIAARPGDRIGLVAFSGAPYLVSPVTLDHDWLMQNLDRLHTGMVRDGTAIGSALAASVNRLRDTRDAKSRIVILLTDGVNNAGKVQPTLAAQAAAAEGVKVYTIGVGREGEAPVPVVDDRGRRRIVMSQVDVDEKTLAEIAQTTGGEFFRATDADSLAKVYAEIDAMEKTTRTTSRITRHEERFAWAALPALGLLGLELATAFGVRRRIP
jgi:Ca-activated chloride channel family protein